MYEWNSLNQYETAVRKEFERRAAHERSLAEAAGTMPTTQTRVWIGHQLVRLGPVLVLLAGLAVVAR